jgi:20S proteasome alpha/beta subunit
MEPRSVEKIMEIDDHVVCDMSGLIADARTLDSIAWCRAEV